jgi:hypothetical protein
VNGIYLPNGTYILNGCPSGGSGSTYYLEAVITKNSSAFSLGIDSGNGIEIEITGDDFSNDGAYVMIRGIVKSAYAIQSLITFKPMLRLAADTDDTYQPYAKTNRELTESYPANKVMMSDGVTSVEEAVDEVTEALTVGTVVNGSVATLDTWLVTNVPIESNGLYSVMYVSNAGMRYQLIVLGANLSTIQTPIGMTGNINEVNNILLAKDDGTNKLCMYVSSGVGTGAYYVAKLIDLFGIV